MRQLAGPKKVYIVGPSEMHMKVYLLLVILGVSLRAQSRVTDCERTLKDGLFAYDLGDLKNINTGIKAKVFGAEAKLLAAELNLKEQALNHEILQSMGDTSATGRAKTAALQKKMRALNLPLKMAADLSAYNSFAELEAAHSKFMTILIRQKTKNIEKFRRLKLEGFDAVVKKFREGAQSSDLLETAE
jgi:hypothetical protein